METTLNRVVRIACTGSESLDFRKIKPMQGSLKSRSKADIDKIIRSIIIHGFSFPFFIWRDGKTHCALDGHGRLSALLEMTKRGYYIDEEHNLQTDDKPWEVPLLPGVFIEARNRDEAKEKLLKLNSRYGVITESGFKLFSEGLKALDLTGISLKFESLELKPPEIKAPEPAMPGPPPSPQAIETETYRPNLEPDIETEDVTEITIARTDDRLQDAMLHKGEVETITLACPVCGESFSVRIADVRVLIEEALK
jgi:hypothetical protein